MAERLVAQLRGQGAMAGDRLAEKIAVLAAQAGQPVDAFAERVLQGLVDADIEIEDGIPVFRMPPNAPTLTSADVDRLLHSDLNS